MTAWKKRLVGRLLIGMDDVDAAPVVRADHVIHDSSEHDLQPEPQVSAVDLEYFQSAQLLDRGDIRQVRAGGVSGYAYAKYQRRLGVHRIRDMHQLSACGVSSSRYAEFHAAGIGDVDLVCRLHLAGFTAESYVAFLADLRDKCGVALGQRLLDVHVAPVVTLRYVSDSVEFANWILQTPENSLKRVVDLCENEDPGPDTVIKQLSVQ